MAILVSIMEFLSSLCVYDASTGSYWRDQEIKPSLLIMQSLRRPGRSVSSVTAFFGPCWSGIPVRTKIVCMRQPPPLRTGRAIARADGDQAVDGYQYDIKVIRWCSR